VSRTAPWFGDVRLVTDRLIVRGVTRGDRKRIIEFLERNAAFHSRWEPTRPGDFFTDRFQRRLMREQAGDPSLLQLYVFPREAENRHIVIGNITFSNIVRGAFQSCFLGYKLDKEWVGKGYMTEALRVSLRHVFVHEKLHRVEANIMPENIPSRNLIERLGFVEEGLARRYLQIQGVWRDHIHYSSVAEEFLEG